MSAFVQRRNVVLEVADADVDYYLTIGYNQVDSTGAVIRQTMPTDVNELQSFYRKHTARIQELESQNARLNAELEALRKPKTTKSKSAEKVE